MNDVPNHTGPNPPVTIKEEEIDLNDSECSQAYMFAVMGARSGLEDIVKSVGNVEFERADKEEEKRSVFCLNLRCSFVVVSKLRSRKKELCLSLLLRIFYRTREFARSHTIQDSSWLKISRKSSGRLSTKNTGTV